MTASTEQERAEFEDGAWYWVEFPSFRSGKHVAPAMYKANCDSWYSYEYSGHSTRFVKVLEPCLMQAARRAPVVPQGWQDLAKRCLKAMEMAVHFRKTGEGRPPEQTCLFEIKELRAMLAAAPQPPEGEKRENPASKPEADHIPDAGQMVSCGCGDMYAPMTFGAAWIYATGKCENCCAAEDAAPVQLPEPAGWIDDGGKVFWNDGRRPDDGEIIYTEHQVRQLLAAQLDDINVADIPQGLDIAATVKQSLTVSLPEPIETVRYWRDAYANPKGDEHFMGHGMVVKVFDDYLALLAAQEQSK